MAGEQNVETTKAAYQAFSNQDAEGAMRDIADDVEWVEPGNSALSGTYHGKPEVGQFWGKLAEKGFRTEPHHWFSDAETVVVLTRVTLGDESAEQADVLTYRDGKLVKFLSLGDTALEERVYGSK